MKKKVIAIVGPTAVGKTELSIKLAESFNGEIISGDSMQVYKQMDIGTAKITEAEMQGIPHYLIDTLNPDEAYSAADFQKDVTKYIEVIHAKGKLPIIVGGSGLYIQAALYQYNFSEKKRDDEITNRLEAELAEYGNTYLHEKLQKVDPDQAEKIHPNNYRRVIRALEIYEATGKTMTAYAKEQETQQESPYESKIYGLEMERTALYDRINRRVDQMMAAGLEDEVRGLYDAGFGDCQSMKAIGYKEFMPYFEGVQSFDLTIDLLKQNSRRFAKRQYTWFRNKMAIDWYTINGSMKEADIMKISDDLAGFLKEK